MTATSLRLIPPLLAWACAGARLLGADDAGSAPAASPTPASAPAPTPIQAAAPIRCLQAWARATQAEALTGAVYLTIANDTAHAVQLTSAATASADHVELHISTTDAQGLMHMEEVPAFTVPAHGLLVLRPEESHLMLIGLRHGLTVGDHLQLTLTIAGETVSTVAVVRPAGAMTPTD